MYVMENVLRNYAWGSKTAIAALLGRVESSRPEAELWLGAHPDSPSSVRTPDGASVPLNTLVSGNPVRFLGTGSVERFGARLPFLTKILAAAHPLSLQVHPSAAQAKAGFDRENAEGLAVDATNRSYRDDNHKPEMIFALSQFEALCGFRPPEQTRDILLHVTAAMEAAEAPVPALLSSLIVDLADGNGSSGLKSAFERLIAGEYPVADDTAMIATALSSGIPLAPFEAELETFLSLHKMYPCDPGVLISLLLNRISLTPGEAVYLPAGNVHAYLSGLGVEVMASSDNVLRGGLTPKFIDVPELLKTINFQAVAVPTVSATTTDLGQELYRTPFQEFQLQRIELGTNSKPIPLAQSGATVVITVAGSVLLRSHDEELQLTRGASAFVPAAEGPIHVYPDGVGGESALAFAVTTGL